MEGVILIGAAILAAIVGAAVGAWLGYRGGQERAIKEAEKQVQSMLAEAEQKARTLVQEAKAEAQELRLQAKEEIVRLRDETEREFKQQRRELQRLENELQQRREKLDRRQEQLDNRARNLDRREQALEKREEEIEALVAEQQAALERVAELSREEARQLLLQQVEEEARQDMARILREREAEAREIAEKKARAIIVTAIQRMATDVTNDVVVSTVALPDDSMKGRIIGRGGRNIRAIENATGVDLVVDDTPEAITISSFDPVRREIARIALERLIADGRIHPARIEKVVEEARAEVEQIIREAGEQAAYEVGVSGLHPELIRLLGQLKFRTSYGQNQWAHAIEAARLATLLAHELGANVEWAKKGALLHDIGKAVTHEVEGPHALIGAEIAKRCGVHPVVVNAIASHHHEVEQETIEAVIVEVADAISGARMGARRESLEQYIKRIKALEDVAKSFDGVQEAYAIQAGREIRVIVRPDDVDDLTAIRLSKEIARNIEESMEYPGQIKVTVIRETRAVDYAK